MVAPVGMVMLYRLDPMTNVCCNSGFVISDVPRTSLAGAGGKGAAPVKNTPSNAFRGVLFMPLIPNASYCTRVGS